MNKLPTQLPRTETSPIQDNQNIKMKYIENQVINVVKEENLNTEFKRPLKRKVDKRKQKKRLNDKIRRLVCPKSPLMIFSELHNGVPIVMEEYTHNNCTVFIALIEIDGQLFIGEHLSKTEAKQKACENYFRAMLTKKMTEESQEKNSDDFPWTHIVSLAMHNLTNQWDIQPADPKPRKKVSGVNQLPANAKNYNPVQLLYQMIPSFKFNEITINSSYLSKFEANCVIDDVLIVGQGPTKRAAKRECAIEIIKCLWNFDFRAV